MKYRTTCSVLCMFCLARHCHMTKHLYFFIFYIHIYLNGVWHEIDGRPRGEGGRRKRTTSDKGGRGV